MPDEFESTVEDPVGDTVLEIHDSYLDIDLLIRRACERYELKEEAREETTDG